MYAIPPLALALLLSLGTTLAPSAATASSAAKPIEVPSHRAATVRLLVNPTRSGKVLDVRNELDVPVEDHAASRAGWSTWRGCATA
ncbi:hypothetical protein SSTU70S_01952 [Stutzerimonas stutzeri]